jgi:hypothetical protein
MVRRLRRPDDSRRAEIPAPDGEMWELAVDRPQEASDDLRRGL